jgi:alkylhydroperoxidase family enzyme
MARIQPLSDEQAPPDVRAEFDAQISAHGRVTNMKRTLGHSLPAFQALMTWYPLRDEVAQFLGDRATYLFAHAISVANDCLICSTFFRRIFIENGENPDDLVLGELDETLIAFGRALTRDAHGVSDQLYGELRKHCSDAQIVTLTAFGAIMIATNIFNDALRVDLDEVLYEFRAPSHAGAT